MSVSAIIVTRGDVDLNPIVDSLPDGWEVIVWDNSGVGSTPLTSRAHRILAGSDLSVYGRYAAIQYASHDLIYVQDDDCIVSDPQFIVDTFLATRDCLEHGPMTRKTVPSGQVVWACDEHDPKPCVMDEVVANMPPEFRHDGYTDSCLVGFGACFQCDAPDRAFDKWWGETERDLTEDEKAVFKRACDVVFTTLTPRVLVDVPVEVLPYAHDDNRMWKQPNHVSERTQVLDLARKVRDGTEG